MWSNAKKKKKKKSRWAGLLAGLWGCLEPRELSLFTLPGHMGPQAIWMCGSGFWLGSLPGQGCRLGFRGSQVLWPVFLSVQKCRGCRLTSLSRQSARSGSTVTMAHWLGDQDQTGLPTSSQHHPWAPWPDRAACSALQLGKATAGPLLWTRMQSTRMWELALSSTLFSISPWSPVARFSQWLPWDQTQVGLQGSIPQQWGS